MRINNNLMAMNTHRMMGNNALESSKSIEKLSSGLRINRAGDDAAGLAISEKMRGQIRGLNQSSRNAQDGISLIQTAEGALQETHEMLQRMRELSTQAANDTSTLDDKQTIQKEINELTSEINRVGNTTEFNNTKLLNSSVSQTARDNVINGLKKGWLELAETSITNAFGLTGSGGDLEIILDSGEAYGTLAYVGGTSAKQELHIDMTDFADGDWENGSNDLGKGFYDDRIIAHEMVHAVMNDEFGATKTNDMQTWFKEGSAEFIHGADERMKQVIGNAGGTGIDATKLSDLVSRASDLLGGAAWVGNDEDYAAGYVIMKYAENNLDTGNTKTFKTLMDDIKTSGASGSAAVESAIAGNTTFADFSAFETSFATNASDYISKAGAHAADGITLNWGADETDTGSIAGSDHGGAALNAEDVIMESATPTINEQPLTGFNVIWPTDSAGGELKLQIGANSNQQFDIKLEDMRAGAISISGTAGGEVESTDGKATAHYTAIDADDASNGVTNGTNSTVTEYALDVSTHDKATAAIAIYDDAIAKVSSTRSKFGSYQNRLEHTIKNLDTSAENLQAAESRVRDVDMSKEIMNNSKSSILSQAAQAMLAQANQAPQGVLQLLR